MRDWSSVWFGLLSAADELSDQFGVVLGRGPRHIRVIVAEDTEVGPRRGPAGHERDQRKAENRRSTCTHQTLPHAKLTAMLRPGDLRDLSKTAEDDYFEASRLLLWEYLLIDSARLGLPDFQPGQVWLVGAGPGDPGLLSALALHALANADVVVYDALVDPRILELARPGAALDYAGKRGGRPSPSQPDISARLVRLADAGNRVLRLKGGDPCVFGRGAEEALALVAAGIPFRIVPGITAGIGGLAYAGIPVTHRDDQFGRDLCHRPQQRRHRSRRAGLGRDRARRSCVGAVHGAEAPAEYRRTADCWRPRGRRGGRDCQQGDHACTACAGVDIG